MDKIAQILDKNILRIVLLGYVALYSIIKKVGKIYLVDYENVRYEGLEGLERLTARDEVIIFDTASIINLKVPGSRSLTCRAKLRIETVYTEGFNSLDFQLCTCLGYLIRSTGREIVIIAKDRLYNTVVRYWENKGRLIRKAVSIEKFLNDEASVISEADATVSDDADCVDNINRTVSDKENSDIDIIDLEPIYHKRAGSRKVKYVDRKAITDVMEYFQINCDIGEIIEIINRENLSEIHAHFVKLLGAEKGRIVYKELKLRKILY